MGICLPKSTANATHVFAHDGVHPPDPRVVYRTQQVEEKSIPEVMESQGSIMQL